MIKYPNGRVTSPHKSDIDYSRRGMSLENDINASNSYYLDTDKAVIHKKPTPITIVNVEYKSRATAKITEAYFQTPSTTDYNGVYRGKYLDFEAKETHSRTSMALSIIHPHQLKHLDSCIRHGGIAFLIVRFVAHDETYLVMASAFLAHLKTLEAKSVKYSWFQENGYLIPYNYSIPVDYLKVIDGIIDGGK